MATITVNTTYLNRVGRKWQAEHPDDAVIQAMSLGNAAKDWLRDSAARFLESEDRAAARDDTGVEAAGVVFTDAKNDYEQAIVDRDAVLASVPGTSRADADAAVS